MFIHQDVVDLKIQIMQCFHSFKFFFKFKNFCCLLLQIFLLKFKSFLIQAVLILLFYSLQVMDNGIYKQHEFFLTRLSVLMLLCIL